MQSMYWRKAYIRYITVVVIGICFTWLLYPSRSHFLYMIRDPWIHDEMEKNKKAEWKKNEKVFEKENLRWIECDPHIISRDHHHRISIQHYYNHSYIVHSQFILSSSLVIAMSKNLFSSHFFRRKYSYRTTGVTNLRIVVSNTVTTFLIWNWRKSTLPQKCKIPSLFMTNHWYWDWHCLQWVDNTPYCDIQLQRLYVNASLYTLRTSSYIEVFSDSKCI